MSGDCLSFVNEKRWVNEEGIGAGIDLESFDGLRIAECCQWKHSSSEELWGRVKQGVGYVQNLGL